MNHEHFMRRCLDLAVMAREQGNTPVGSVVVLAGAIIGEGIETLPTGTSITGHAVTLACQAAIDATGRKDLAETAERLSPLVGRQLSYQPETREEALAWRSKLGAHDWEINAWVSSFEAIAAGELAQVSDTVPRLTGSSATGLEAFFAREPVAVELLSERLSARST
jgi:pyrimidine deaminase RibD-like protein